MLIDPKPLWDFDDPAASEARFLAEAESAEEPAASAWMTQAARALGLQGEFGVAHAMLDGITVSGVAVVPTSLGGGSLPAGPAEVAVRLDLERGRLFNSAGDAAAALPLFRAAARRAADAGFEELALDGLHMVAIASPLEGQLARNQEALAAARAATDPAARNWEASILNNIGMVHADAGDFAAALSVFEEALAARERIGDPARTRVARWMVAWSLRNLGRTDEALAAQRALKAELTAAGATAPYVDEELAILEGRPTT